MKKTLITKFILPLAFLSIITGSSKNIKADLIDSHHQLEKILYIGKPMPKPKGKFIKRSRNNSIEFRIYVNQNGLMTEVETYKRCNGTTMKKPFAIYRFKENTTYVDNKNKDGRPYSDGTIDDFSIHAPSIPYEVEMPLCVNEI